MINDNAPVLSLAGVEKSYGKAKALESISFSGAAGELVVLLGPNGAGKSTLVQLLTGLFAPDRGEIRVAGYDLRRDAVQALAHIGVVFQQQTLDLDLTVTANLLFHADLHGMARRTARARVSDALARFDLGTRADARVRTLSGGNRRRVELARALLHRPSVLFMDEATVGLDPASRRDIIAHILDLKQRHRILVVWTTHLVDEAEHADRLIVLDHGRILFEGPHERMLARTGVQSIGEAFLEMTGSAAEGPAP